MRTVNVTTKQKRETKMAQKKGAVNFTQEKNIKNKIKYNKAHAEINKQKHLRKSKLNRF